MTYYNQSGPQSFAETISFWVAADTGKDFAGRYALYRRVNKMAPTIVARGLVIRPGDPPPFTYTILNALGQPISIPGASLPAFHVAQHGSPADTGKASLTDSVRSVRVHLVGTYYGTRGDSSFRAVDMGIRLMNAGLLQLATCGEAPVFGQTVTATYTTTPTTKVTVAFTPAFDEKSGEKDVERYAIYRRLSTATAFGDPITSIPAGQASYSYADATIQPGISYVYAVAAQDCGGQFSSVDTSAAVAVP
jgi:hypothetical protein